MQSKYLCYDRMIKKPIKNYGIYLNCPNVQSQFAVKRKKSTLIIKEQKVTTALHSATLTIVFHANECLPCFHATMFFLPNKGIAPLSSSFLLPYLVPFFFFVGEPGLHKQSYPHFLGRIPHESHTHVM